MPKPLSPVYVCLQQAVEDRDRGGRQEGRRVEADLCAGSRGRWCPWRGTSATSHPSFPSSSPTSARSARPWSCANKKVDIVLLEFGLKSHDLELEKKNGTGKDHHTVSQEYCLHLSSSNRPSQQVGGVEARERGTCPATCREWTTPAQLASLDHSTRSPIPALQYRRNKAKQIGTQ